jgi:hypothetical protein
MNNLLKKYIKKSGYRYNDYTNHFNNLNEYNEFLIHIDNCNLDNEVYIFELLNLHKCLKDYFITEFNITDINSFILLNKDRYLIIKSSIKLSYYFIKNFLENDIKYYICNICFEELNEISHCYNCGYMACINCLIKTSIDKKHINCVVCKYSII